MRQKGLSQRDVVLRSGSNIGAGYISEITSGKVTNISTDKLKALAKGLDVDVMELCAIVCRAPYSPNPDPLAFLDLMQRVLSDSVLTEITENSVRLSRKEQQTILDLTNTMLLAKRRKSKASS
jgi:transcriptional regulator with XRE-family HTH domain